MVTQRVEDRTRSKEEHGSSATTAETSSPRIAALVLLVSLIALSIAQMASTEAEITHDGAHYLEIARNIRNGDGFVTRGYWALNLPREEIPFPDTYRAPLFPALVALASFVVSDFNDAGKAVTVVTGALIPFLVFLTMRNRLGLGVSVSLLGAAIALTNHHLVISGTRALTETPFTAFVLTAIFFATGPRPRPILAGIFAALATLVRYQGYLLLPVFALIFWLRRRQDATWARGLTVAVTLFAVIMLPWWVRTYRLTGSPVYSDLKWHVVSTYDPNLSYYEYFHGIDQPEEPLTYITQHIDRTVVGFGKRAAYVAQRFPGENAGNHLLFIFAIAGILAARRLDRRTPSPVMSSWLAYGVLNILLIAFTFAQVRHLTSLDPFVAILSALGAVALYDHFRSKGPRIAAGAVAALLILGIATEVARSVRKLERDVPTNYAYADAARDLLERELGPDEAVMAPSPYYFSYLMDRNALSLPWSSDAELKRLAERFKVRFVVLPTDALPPIHEESSLYSKNLPHWMRERQRPPGSRVRVLEILHTEDAPKPTDGSSV